MKKIIWLLLCLMASVSMHGQNVSSRTNEFEVDFSNPAKLVTSTIPVINWISPTAETNYVADTKYKINFTIESNVALKNIIISVKENAASQSRGMMSIVPATEEEKHRSKVEKNLTLLEGTNVIEIIAENADGTKTYSSRMVTVGSTA